MSDTAEPLARMFDFQSDLTILTCGMCHIRFAMPVALYHTCMEKDERGFGKKPFFCPNGHRLVFHNREIDQLRTDRDRLQQKLAEVEDEKNAAINAKGEAERALARNIHRAAAGVCPCCNRSFNQLARHMQSRHPELVTMPVKPSKASPAPITVRKVRGQWTMVRRAEKP